MKNKIHWKNRQFRMCFLNSHFLALSNPIKYSLFISLSVLWFLTACHLEPKKSDTSPPPTTTTPTTTPSQVEEQSNYRGSISLTNSAKYRELLRNLKVCDPCTLYTGPLDCEYFDSTADISIVFDKKELPAKATITIQPHYSGSKWGALKPQLFLNVGQSCNLQYPSYIMPINMNGTARYVNNYKGFYVELKSAGGLMMGSLLGKVVIKSDFSNPAEHSALDVRLYYGGGAAGASAGSQFGTAKVVDEHSDHADGGGHISGR